ncbi:hypothetical protein R1flu_010327 [Riccia fluitans]|uniref:Uncharacterized protein n=1 Tax=Riccia fluitans TaxID=41844 RepID=A0ABD1Z5F8_9MARC
MWTTLSPNTRTGMQLSLLKNENAPNSMGGLIADFSKVYLQLPWLIFLPQTPHASRFGIPSLMGGRETDFVRRKPPGGAEANYAEWHDPVGGQVPTSTLLPSRRRAAPAVLLAGCSLGGIKRTRWSTILSICR